MHAYVLYEHRCPHTNGKLYPRIISKKTELDLLVIRLFEYNISDIFLRNQGQIMLKFIII